MPASNYELLKKWSDSLLVDTDWPCLVLSSLLLDSGNFSPDSKATFDFPFLLLWTMFVKGQQIIRM